MESLVLELDVSPAAPIEGRAIDFAGRQLAAFTQRRWLEAGGREDGGNSGLLQAVRTTDGGLNWVLIPGEEIVRSDGATMDGDMLQTLLESHEVVRTARLDGPYMHVTLERPNACFPLMLASDAFVAPQAAGSFDIVGRVGERGIALRRNRVGARLWPEGPEAVTFAVVPDAVQGVRGFERSMIDITSNPNLPIDIMRDYAASPRLRREAMLLAGVLMFPGTVASGLSGPEGATVRRALSGALNRTQIVERCDHTLSAITSLFDLWDGTGAGGAPLPGGAFANFPEQLTLCYADFPPNDIVVDQVVQDIAEVFGVRVLATALSYQDFLRCLAAPNCDIIYSLVQPPFDDPTSLVGVFGSETWLGPATRPFVTSLQAAQKSLCREERFAACSKARKICDEMMPVVPIVQAQSKCLVSDRGAELDLGRDGIFRPPVIERNA